MSNNSNLELGDHLELPHNAWFDAVTGQVTFAIERFTLSFDVEEFLVFASQIDDIASILEQMIVREKEVCEHCGTELELVSLQPPAPEDFN